MTNFKQICKVKTNYNTKQPEIVIRENQHGRFLNGKIQWLDGKDKDGKQLFTWIHICASKPEIIELLMYSHDKLLEVEGFLKNNGWIDKEGQPRNKVEGPISGPGLESLTSNTL